MLFGMNALLLAPLIKPVKNNKQLHDVFKHQGNMIEGFNKMLGCHRPDKAKVAYDAEHAAKTKK